MSNESLKERRSGTAVWKQIEKELLADIVRGEFPPGDKLPSESALAARFAVNRHTVRRALAELNAQRIVAIENGRGTFVTEAALRYRIDRRSRSLESMIRDGYDMKVNVLGQKIFKASRTVAEALDLAPQDDVWMLDSLSVIEGRPALLAKHDFPQSRFPGLITKYKKLGSISATLAAYGVKSTRKSMKITARLGEPDELNHLKETWPAALICVESIYVDQNDRPVDFGVARYSGLKVELEID